MSLLTSLLKGWEGPLHSLERNPYLSYLVRTLNSIYEDEESIIYPESREDIFAAFKMVKPEELKVVILGLDPYPTPNTCTGYAFANQEGYNKMAPSLKKIYEVIEEELYDGLYLDFDITLSHWAKQGILSLNSALTVLNRKPGSHAELWRPFTEIVIKDLSDNFDNLYFCFWGKVAQGFQYLVDGKKHEILTCYHPAYAVRQGRRWNCDHFKIINEDLGIKW